VEILLHAIYYLSPHSYLSHIRRAALRPKHEETRDVVPGLAPTSATSDPRSPAPNDTDTRAAIQDRQWRSQYTDTNTPKRGERSDEDGE
jgi:hypothetical protein